MKTTENVKLTTAGKLLSELKKYEKKYWDYSVTAWTDEDQTLGIVGIGKDQGYDLRIIVEEVEEELEGIWTVADVIQSLEKIDKSTRVYLAGHGYYFAIDSNRSFFTEDDDNEVVGCYVTIIKKHKLSSCRNSNDKRELAEMTLKKRLEGHETIALAIIVIAVFCWLVYNIYAMFTGIGSPTWEKILWIVGCIIVLAVCSSTLYYSKK